MGKCAEEDSGWAGVQAGFRSRRNIAELLRTREALEGFGLIVARTFVGWRALRSRDVQRSRIHEHVIAQHG
jgi:hypothetical protein